MHGVAVTNVDERLEHLNNDGKVEREKEEEIDYHGQHFQTCLEC